MKKTLLIFIITVLTVANGYSNNLSRDQFIKDFADLSPTICDNSKHRKNSDLKLCLGRAGLALGACGTNYYSLVPEKLSKVESKRWGKLLGNCALKVLYTLHEADSL